jgi:hypothetical protein
MVEDFPNIDKLIYCSKCGHRWKGAKSKCDCDACKQKRGDGPDIDELLRQSWDDPCS